MSELTPWRPAVQRFAAVIMRIRDPKTTALIFASGKMVRRPPRGKARNLPLSQATHRVCALLSCRS